MLCVFTVQRHLDSASRACNDSVGPLPLAALPGSSRVVAGFVAISGWRAVAFPQAALFSNYRRDLVSAGWTACNGDFAWSIKLT